MKTNQPLSRRDFLGLSVAGSIALLSQNTTVITSPQETIRVRYDVNSSDLMAKKNLETFIKIVKIMTGKEQLNGSLLPKDDYRHWLKQAEVHKTHCINKDVKQVHDSWKFLPWHRAYLYYFEQIGRSFPGCENFTIPYWNWTKDPKLPEIFADANLAGLKPPWKNNDFVWERYPKAGDSIPMKLYGEKFSDTRINAYIGDLQKGIKGQSFWAIVGRKNGGKILESTAHNAIHREFVLGNMLDPLTAALDPVFWLHHANIDRLWSKWMMNTPDQTPTPKCQIGGASSDCCNNNIDVCEWLNTSVEEFYDVKGKLVSPKIRTLLDTYNSLGYRYDDLPETPFPIGNGSSIQKTGLPDSSIQRSFDNQIVKVNKLLTVSVCKDCSIPQTLTTSLKKFSQKNLLKKVSPAKSTKKNIQLKQTTEEISPIFLLTIEVGKPANPRISVRVFIHASKANQQNQQIPNIDSPSYIATVGFFESFDELERHDGMDMNNKSRKFIFDVTKNIEKLDRLKPFTLETATVSISPIIFGDTSGDISGDIKLLGFNFEVAK